VIPKLGCLDIGRMDIASSAPSGKKSDGQRALAPKVFCNHTAIANIKNLSIPIDKNKE
jgi:hypothetical protein